MRELARCALLAACALSLAACQVEVRPAPVVVEEPRASVEWTFYPEHDIYWSAAYGWCYWDGAAWITVHTRPAWITLGPVPRRVVIHGGARPHVHWSAHVRTYGGPARHHPRRWHRR